jgi:hypothetical protein
MGIDYAESDSACLNAFFTLARPSQSFLSHPDHSCLTLLPAGGGATRKPPTYVKQSFESTVLWRCCTRA